MVKRIVILTGANRGLGRTTAEILLKDHSKDYTYILTQRSKDHKKLTEEFQKINPNADFEFKDLDVSNKASRADFKIWFAQKYHKLDVLFNNAGVYDHADSGTTKPSQQIAQTTLDINFFGTVEFTEELFPLLTDDGKIIEISSYLGSISLQPEAAQKILADPTLSRDRLFQLANDYIKDSTDLKKEPIFANVSYYVSKALLNAYVRYVAVKYIKANQSVFTVHPGWVKTDLGTDAAPLTKDYACPFLANIVAQFPYGRHPLSGKFQFENKEMVY